MNVQKERRSQKEGKMGKMRVGDCGGGVVNEGGVEVEGNSRRSRDVRILCISSTAGDKLSSKKCNFGIAPVCMPFQPFIVWDSLGKVPLFIFLDDEGTRDSVLMVMSKVSI